jgi:hypothetical protein
VTGRRCGGSTPGLGAGLGIVLALAAATLLGCETELPEPASRGARLYRARCQGCHRLYQPGAMTSAMWRLQVERMQREFARRGIPQLPPDEMELLLAYLDAHSTDAARSGAKSGARAGGAPTGAEMAPERYSDGLLDGGR